LRQMFLVLVYSRACSPCKMFAQSLAALFAQFPRVLFAKVLQDDTPDVMHELSPPVIEFPTVIFFLDGVELERVAPSQIGDVNATSHPSEVQ
jgi:thioredoxin-like negative regulator of GroEL